jgi:hypothetical protein
MINKLCLAFFIGFLFGCSPAERPVAESSGESVGDDTSTSQTNEPDGYNEYMWCQHGPNYSSDSHKALMVDWTERVNALGMSELGHSTLTTVGQGSEEFDSIVVLRWADKEARDTGWAAYKANDVDASLQADHPGVIACGGDEMQQYLWSFNRYQRPASVQWDREKNPQARVGYRFCSYNSGKSVEDLLEVVRGPFAEYLDSYESSNGPSSYSYGYLDPDFDPSTAPRSEGVPVDYDFSWMNFWGDPNEQVPSDSLWIDQGKDIQASFDEVAECSEEQFYDISVNKMPASST